MGLIQIVIALIVVVIVMELVKHLFFKKSSKIFKVVIITLAVFLLFSYAFKDVDHVGENKIIQTGAAITEEISQTFEEKVDTEGIINSTVKTNKLFKSKTP